MKALFLDDLEDRHVSFKKLHDSSFPTGVDYVYTYDAAVDHLKHIEYNMVFLDHDLSFGAIMCDPDDCDEKTGTDLVQWIVQHMDPNDPNTPGFVIHSLNPVGRKRMVDVLVAAGFDAKPYPFYWLCPPGYTIPKL